MDQTADDETRYEHSRHTTEMVALVERWLRGEVTRAEVSAWALALHQTHGNGAFGSGPAHTLHSSLYNFEERLYDGDELIVRREDIEEQLRALRHGEVWLARAPVAVLRLTPQAIAARTGTRVTRFLLDGLGWLESVRFASPATNRCFVAMGPLRVAAARSSVQSDRGAPQAPAAAVLADLFDTLALDLDDTEPAGEPPPLRRWRLLRSDDNGNTEPVASFSGYAKARAQLAAFEAGAHKQVYWIEVDAKANERS
jgi:hypothetical protein